MMEGRDRGRIEDIESLLSYKASKAEKARARATLASGRLIVVWERPLILVFMGDHGDHVLVDSNYCSCESFYFSLLRGTPGCYHVRAVRLAPEELVRLKRINASLDDVWNIVYEVLSTGFSPTLRRLLFTKH